MDLFVLSEVLVQKIFPNKKETVICPVDLGDLTFIGDINEIACGVPVRMGMPNIKNCCYMLFDVIPNVQFIMSMRIVDIDRIAWSKHIEWLNIENSLMLRLVSMYLRLSGYDANKGCEDVDGGKMFGGVFVSSAVCVTIRALYKTITEFKSVQCNNVYKVEDFSNFVNNDVYDISSTSHSPVAVIDTLKTVEPANGVINFVALDKFNSASTCAPIVFSTVGLYDFYIEERVSVPVSPDVDCFEFIDSNQYYCLPVLNKACSVSSSSTPKVWDKHNSNQCVIFFSESMFQYVYMDLYSLASSYHCFTWSPDLHVLLQGCTVIRFVNGFLVTLTHNHTKWGRGSFFFPYRLNRSSIMYWLARFLVGSFESKLSYSWTSSYVKLIQDVVDSPGNVKVKYKYDIHEGVSMIRPTIHFDGLRTGIRYQRGYQRHLLIEYPTVYGVDIASLNDNSLSYGSFDSSFFDALYCISGGDDKKTYCRSMKLFCLGSGTLSNVRMANTYRITSSKIASLDFRDPSYMTIS